MSYTPGFAPDAESQWHALDPLLQELALDELDRFALNPPPPGEYVGDAARELAGLREYVFVHVIVDDGRRTVTAIGVGYTSRSATA